MQKTMIILIVLCLSFVSALMAQNHMLYFDGIDDYVEVEDVSDFQFANESFSASCWVKVADNANTYRSYICLSTSGGNPRIRLLKYRSGLAHGRLRVEITASGQSAISSISTGSEIPKNEWIHLAYVVDYENSLLKFYIDGIFQGSANLVNFDFSSGPNLRLTFGRDPVYGHIHNSVMDEVRIWNTALDQSTIQEWMDKSVTPAHPNWSDLIGYWKFDEGSGQTVFDSSGNGNDGRLGGLTDPDGQDPSWDLSDSPLPVVLSSFTAIQTQANYAQISWTTQSETDLYGYNIYRSDENELNNSVKLNSSIIDAENTTIGSEYTFLDQNVEYEQIYYYWLESVDLGGTTEFFGPISISLENNNQIPELPNETLLRAAYPNPFNPKTTINFLVK